MKSTKSKFFGKLKVKVLVIFLLGFFYVTLFPKESSRAEKKEINSFIKTTNNIIKTCENTGLHKQELKELKKEIKRIMKIITEMTNKLSKGERTGHEIQKTTNELLKILKSPYTWIITILSSALSVLVASLIGLKKKDIRSIIKKVFRKQNKEETKKLIAAEMRIEILRKGILKNKNEYFEQLKAEVESLKHIVSTLNHLGIKKAGEKAKYSKKRIEKIKAEIIVDYSEMEQTVVGEARAIENQIRKFEASKNNAMTRLISTLNAIKKKKLQA